MAAGQCLSLQGRGNRGAGAESEALSAAEQLARPLSADV